jgi:hypothetical protein
VNIGQMKVPAIVVLNLTEKAKVASMYYSVSICLAGEVVEAGQTPSNVRHTKDTAMGGIKNFCLGIYLVTCWSWWSGGDGRMC